MFQFLESGLEIHRSRNTIFPWTDSQGPSDANQTHKRIGTVKAICLSRSLHLSWCLLYLLDAQSVFDIQMKQRETERKCIDLSQETFLSYSPKFPHLLFSLWKTKTSISSRDRVRDQIYSPAWNCNKNEQNIWNQSFQDTGHQTRKGRDGKQVRWALWFAPSWLPGEVFPDPRHAGEM